MSRLRIALAVLLAASALAVVAVPASAAVPAANTKYCKALTGISDKLSKGSSTSSLSADRAALEKYATSLKSAAKDAPASVKKATQSLASFYHALASGDVSAFKGTKNLTNAVTKVTTYLATNCTS
jgi:hypothetical protein